LQYANVNILIILFRNAFSLAEVYRTAVRSDADRRDRFSTHRLCKLHLQCVYIYKSDKLINTGVLFCVVYIFGETVTSSLYSWISVELESRITREHERGSVYKSNKIKIGVNDMTVNDSEMCAR